MSGPIKAKILSAIKSLTKLKGKTDFDFDPAALSVEEQAAKYEAQLLRIRQEIKTANLNSDLIRTSLQEWVDLLRKVKEEDRKKANEEFTKFHDEQKLDQMLEAYDSAVSDLRDVEEDVGIKWKVAMANLDKANKAADLAHQQALAAAVAAAQSGVGTSTSAATVAAPAPVAHPLTAMYSLPQLKIPPFSGDRKGWVEFYESFRCAVDKRPGTGVEKLNMLRTVLDGEAKELIAGFRLEESNYREALQLLKDTYGDKGTYVRNLHSELVNLKPCSNLEDTKKFVLQLERLARELKNMGEDIESPAVYLNLEKKLNKPFLREILTAKAAHTGDWTTTDFRKALNIAVQKEASIQEIYADYGLQKKPANQQNQQNAHQRQQHGSQKPAHMFQNAITDEQKSPRRNTAPQAPKRRQQRKSAPSNQNRPRQFESSQNTQFQKRSPPPCVFCNGSHWNDECSKYQTVQERKKAAREAKRCLRCLREGHFAANCQKPAKCFYCKKNHPSAFCYEKHSTTAQKSPHVQSSQQKSNEVDGEKQVAVQQTKNTKTLLMTLETQVYNPTNPKLCKMARIFLDTGSQRSFV